MYQVMAHEAARRGDTPAAIQEYREALKINPKLPGLHFELAEMLHSLPVTAETSAQAKSEYEAALAQNPFDEKADPQAGGDGGERRRSEKSLRPLFTGCGVAARRSGSEL
jgi:tetratricopeptide (TPR) repeat protein